MNFYFVTKNEFEENLKVLETVIKMLRGNYSPESIVVWMPWESDADEYKNTDYYKWLDDVFKLKDKGINLEESFIYPDGLIWDANCEVEILISDAKELSAYIYKLRGCIRDSNRKRNDDNLSDNLPDAFVYEMLVDVKYEYCADGGTKKALIVEDRGLMNHIPKSCNACSWDL